MPRLAARRGNFLDRVLALLAPAYALARTRARIASELLARHYEGASLGRRTAGWAASMGDANAVMGLSLHRLRAVARDLVRNNGNAKAALRTICNHTVGWGIVVKPLRRKGEAKGKHQKAMDAWRAWAETTACDTEGRLDFYGLQKLVLRTVVESGECLVRRRLRRPEDELPIPLQLQVLDPDYLDTERTGQILPNGHKVVHGVEYDLLGRRVAYYLFPEHPGAETQLGRASSRVPAESVIHVFYPERPGQVRGPTWFAASLVRFKDYHEYQDAALLKQKVAACLAVLVSDLDGSSTPLGQAEGLVDMIEPGWVGHVPQGTTVTPVEPPRVAEHAEYSKFTLRELAAGLGTTYEDLTGDYSGMPFSAARMSRLAHWQAVEDWRWMMLIPQFCDGVWAWAMLAAGVMGIVDAMDPPVAVWTAPPAPMVDPANEGRAYMLNARTGLQTMPEILRERGRDPEEVLEELTEWNKALDAAGVMLDSDPRRLTQAGNPVAAMAGGAQPPGGEPGNEPPPAEEPGGGEEGGKKKPPEDEDEE